MTAPMYKDGKSMEVTDDPVGRAQLVKHGWSESEPVKKQPKAKKVVADDNSK